MPLPVLVVDGDAAVEEGGESRGVERLGDLDREERLGLVEQESAISVRGSDESIDAWLYILRTRVEYKP